MKEHDIRPRAILDEFLQLLSEDTRIFFAEAPLVAQDCFACGAASEHAFDKNGFSYAECRECLTLYVNPRPERAAFDRYYKDSASTRYWATTFYKATESARREQLWKPKARLIKEKILKFGRIDEIVDIGGGYGAFAEEMRGIADWKIVIIEPSVHLSRICREKGFPVVEKFLENVRREDLSDKSRCFVSFELFEHLFDPKEFLRGLNALMRGGDLFIFTTLSGLGVDIQALWEDSKAVTPPQHLNFFNPAAMRRLLAKAGFETLEVTTPGKLDMDILQNNLSQVKDRFWRNYLRIATESEKSAMQAFISEQGLSSHMMAICRKK
jgi:hypothetical protein